MGRYDKKTVKSNENVKAQTAKGICGGCFFGCKGTCSLSCTGHSSSRPPIGQSL